MTTKWDVTDRTIGKTLGQIEKYPRYVGNRLHVWYRLSEDHSHTADTRSCLAAYLSACNGHCKTKMTPIN